VNLIINFIKVITDNHLGDLSSVLGIVIVIIGFVITIITVLRSKRAAQRAEEAVQQVRKDIEKINTIEEFSAAIAKMNEIKRLHRTGTWIILPDRYSSLKKSLISIGTTNTDMSEAQKSSLQNAIQHFSNIENQVEIALANQEIPKNVAKLNQIITKQIDNLNNVLLEIKNKVGR